MILLDTNVISEIMKQQPSYIVIDWLDQHSSTELFISTVSIAEIVYGINALPEGARRQTIWNAFNKAVQEAFKYRLWSFDEAAAYEYGNNPRYGVGYNKRECNKKSPIYPL